jgi:hypothetical protein
VEPKFKYKKINKVYIMSVNIFGSSESAQSSGANREYVDHKFTTLSTNLATKVNKSGDTMSGALNMESCSIYNVKDPVNDNEVSNKIYVDHKSIALTNNLDTKLSRSGDRMIGDLNMGGYSINNVKDPVNDNDVANKIYVDERQNAMLDKLFIKNSVGLIPNLTSNTKNKSGYNVAASSELKDHAAYYAFNSNKTSGWGVADGVNTDFWIEITCPEPILIYKCVIRGRLHNDVRLNEWKLQGNIGDGFHMWTDVYVAHNISVDSSVYTFYVHASIKYSKYRIYVANAEGNNPGLSHWQLYTLDEIKSDVSKN